MLGLKYFFFKKKYFWIVKMKQTKKPQRLNYANRVLQIVF